MSTIHIVPKQGDLDADDKKIMVDGMLAYHESKGHKRTVNTFSALRD